MVDGETKIGRSLGINENCGSVLRHIAKSWISSRHKPDWGVERWVGVYSDIIQGLHVVSSIDLSWFDLIYFFTFFFFLSFVFLWPRLQHMDVPRPEVESELHLPAYTTATAAPDLSCVCNLHHSSGQCWILNPLSEAEDRTLNLMVPFPLHRNGNSYFFETTHYNSGDYYEPGLKNIFLFSVPSEMSRPEWTQTFLGDALSS